MDSNGSSGVLDSAADMEHVRNDIDSVETREWLDSLDSVLQTSGID
ncbi:MAG: hypothetical protein RIR17_813, partial [Planctomycetota bacterium]